MTHTSPPVCNPYRENHLVPSCVVCHAPAIVRCPACGRPFCGDHATVSSACPDCELQVARRTHRVSMWLMSGYAVLATAACVVVGLGNGLLGIEAGSFSLLGGLMVAAAGRRLARRKADGAWELVENAVLAIGADAGEPRHRRLGHLMAGRGRETDQYTAARNAGFNRVQGCA